MVMGQEERKNKAKLEKTQISLATSNAEYEHAVKALEDTTARWNREWKHAADKFQDLEEERLDFTKSSLWAFANIASTVCVSDDASCEKIRLSLEKLEVEKDIVTFIRERGTGQEIPDPPKYINFCRGDVDSQSEASVDDESYSVAQFPRSINPAFRSSSPQPSTYESHHDPNSTLARDLGHLENAPLTPQSREATVTPQKAIATMPDSQRSRHGASRSYQAPRVNNIDYDPAEFSPVPHEPYPLDGMTMLCRPTASDLSTAPSSSSARPSSRDSHSETSFSSQEPPREPPMSKQMAAPTSRSEPVVQEKKVLKKKSGFFQNHSPFGRKKSTREVAPSNRNTWHPSNNNNGSRVNLFGGKDRQALLPDRTVSPEPIDANATLALNVGQNVFPVERATGGQSAAQQAAEDDDDPIALALAELKGVAGGATKQASERVSADRYHGIATPSPSKNPLSRSVPPPGSTNSAVAAAMRGTPPPSYEPQTQRLGVPPPAVTSRAMKESSQKFQNQTRSMFTERSNPAAYGSVSRPATRGNEIPRAASPAPPRSVSPRPGRADVNYQNRSASPNPYSGSQSKQQRGSSGQANPKRGSDQGYYRQNSPNDFARPGSSMGGGRAPEFARPGSSAGGGRAPEFARSGSSMGDRSGAEDGYGSQRGRGGRPGTSQGNRAMTFYEGSGPVQPASRQRSKSVADPSRQFTRDGRPIMHFGTFIPPSSARSLCCMFCFLSLLALLLTVIQLVPCTCTKQRSLKSLASPRAICSPSSATRTMVGGRRRRRAEMGRSGWSPAITCRPSRASAIGDVRRVGVP